MFQAARVLGLRVPPDRVGQHRRLQPGAEARPREVQRGLRRNQGIRRGEGRHQDPEGEYRCRSRLGTAGNSHVLASQEEEDQARDQDLGEPTRRHQRDFAS